MGTPGDPIFAPKIEAFEERYFLWALKDAEREVDVDFQLLRQIPDRSVKTFLDFALGLPMHERIQLMKAQVVNGHPISKKLNCDITQEQAALLKYSFEYVRKQISGSRGWYAGFPLKVPRKEFKAVLRSSLDTADIGEYDPWDLPNGWRYIFKHGLYTVYTHLDINGPNRQLWYYHAIHLEEKPLYEWISFTSWLGLGPTYFDFVPKDGLVEAADVLRRVCRHFIAALPELLP